MQAFVKLLLVRHAERAATGTMGDEPLSTKGKLQAIEVSYAIKEAFEGSTPTILSSPKKRALETAREIALRSLSSVEILPSLEESHSGESPTSFVQRVKTFLVECQNRKWSSCVVAVSHSDWLEQAVVSLLQGATFIHWFPASAHLFEFTATKAIHLKTIRP